MTRILLAKRKIFEAFVRHLPSPNTEFTDLVYSVFYPSQTV